MNKLKECREKLSLTQKQVAELVGIPEQVYQRYEYGKRIPTAIVACRIAKVLTTTVEELYGD